MRHYNQDKDLQQKERHCEGRVRGKTVPEVLGNPEAGNELCTEHIPYYIIIPYYIVNNMICRILLSAFARKRASYFFLILLYVARKPKAKLEPELQIDETL